jgi:hypothetical protein
MDNWWMPLGVEHNSQGAKRITNQFVPLAPNYDGKVEQYYRLEWQIVEELCVQRVFVALAQEFGIKEAIGIFPHVFLMYFTL